jgi:hypothetical protein
VTLPLILWLHRYDAAAGIVYRCVIGCSVCMRLVTAHDSHTDLVSLSHSAVLFLQTMANVAYTTTTSGMTLALMAERATLAVRTLSAICLPSQFCSQFCSIYAVTVQCCSQVLLFLILLFCSSCFALLAAPQP